MSKNRLIAGFRSLLGSPNNHNTLEILKDTNGYILVIQEQNDCGKMRSQGVRVEKPASDKHQIEIFRLVTELTEAIKKAHKKNPGHPSFIVGEEE